MDAVERTKPRSEPEAPSLASRSDRQPYELWFAFAATLLPHVLGVLAGSYGRIVTVAPLAIGLAAVDFAGMAVAALQLREDRAAGRRTHWLVWATLIAGVAWAVYAAAILVIFIIVRVFCVNQTCRPPLG